MKYNPEDYLDCGFWDGDMDGYITNKTEKVVKCRKPHICGSCGKEIKAGEQALRETGFEANEGPYACYACLPCVEVWLEESGQVGFDNEDGEQDER